MTGEKNKDNISTEVVPKLATPWGVLPFLDFFKVPHSWSNGLPASFRILEWAYPYHLGGARVGLYECVVESLEARCEKVYMWKERDSLLITAGRPPHLLPPQPVHRDNDSRHQGQRFALTSFYQINGCMFQRYHYGLKTERSVTDACHTTDNDNCPSMSSIPDLPNIREEVTEWWPPEETTQNLSSIQINIISERHLSVEKTVVGEGAFGTVFLRTLGGVKQVVTKSFAEGLSTSEDILREAKLLALLSDTGVVPLLFGVCYATDFRISIVQEYCANGVTLYDVLYGFYNLSNDKWLKIVRQLAFGLRAIHRKGVLLNDLKEDNILVDCQSGQYNIRFIDFGLATFKDSRVYHVDVKERRLRAQLAPEVLEGQPTKPSSDVYSLGKIVDNVAYQCDICGLSDVAKACLSPETTRPSIDRVISLIEDLNPALHIDL